MLTVKGNKVIFEGSMPEDLLKDTRCVISAFIKSCKQAGIPDELLEKTCIAMIAEGFEMPNKNQMFEIHKEERRNGD